MQIVQKVPLRNPFEIKEIRIRNHDYFSPLSEFLPIVNVDCKTVAAALPCHRMILPRFLAFLDSKRF